MNTLLNMKDFKEHAIAEYKLGKNISFINVYTDGFFGSNNADPQALATLNIQYAENIVDVREEAEIQYMDYVKAMVKKYDN